MILLSVNGSDVAEADSSHPALGDEFLSKPGIFETMRIYSGNPFRLEEHLSRFLGAAEKLNMPVPAEVRSIVQSQIRRAADFGFSSAFFRLTLTQSDGHSTFVTLITDLPAQSSNSSENGIRVVTSDTTRDEFAPTAGIKTTAWLSYIRQFRATASPDATDAILLDTQGHVSEATASNIFLMLDDTLFTPPVSCGALPGITRDTVLGLARQAGLQVEDSLPIAPKQLLFASEIFLTSSIREIVPVISVDGRLVGPGIPGHVARRMMNAYRDITR